MHAKFRGMTLQTLLRQHGITTIKELIHRTGLLHRYCWSLWHGYDRVEGNAAPVAYVAWDSPGILAPGRPVPVAKRPRTTTQQPRGRPRTRRMGGRLAMRKRQATYPDVIEIWGITAPEDEMLATAVHYERIMRRGGRCVTVDFGLTLNRFGWEEDDITITDPEKEDADA